MVFGFVRVSAGIQRTGLLLFSLLLRLYFYISDFDLMRLKKQFKIIFDWQDPCRVGETLSFRILVRYYELMPLAIHIVCRFEFRCTRIMLEVEENVVGLNT
jgi:hypothetical protein